jgi:hypothetical protein
MCFLFRTTTSPNKQANHILCHDMFFLLLTTSTIELHPDLVFWYGIGWYFFGIFLTDTEGKLGMDLLYRTFCGNHFFPSKGAAGRSTLGKKSRTP